MYSFVYFDIFSYKNTNKIIGTSTVFRTIEKHAFFIFLPWDADNEFFHSTLQEQRQATTEQEPQQQTPPPQEGHQQA